MHTTSFGSALKTFRRRGRISQRVLAERLGVHHNTIWRWEQGNGLPDSRGMVLELARLLDLNEPETRQLLEASLTAISPYFLVPLPRNPLFTGREEIMDVLHAYLGVESAVASTRSYALHGLGGVGKTQLALEYAYRYALEYSAVFWIEAESAASITSSLLHIAAALQLPEQGGKDPQQVIAAVQNWLAADSQWLLIWDSLEDLALLGRFLPATHSGKLLLTTRRQTLGTLARGISVLPMEREEGLLFLLRRASVLDTEATSEQVRHLAMSRPAEYAAAAVLIPAMEGLPLALDQAGAYVDETGCSMGDYLQLCRSHRKLVLARRGSDENGHPASVTTTLRLSIERVERVHPLAIDLLRACAFLHAGAIPEELLIAGAAHLGPDLAQVITSQYQFDLLLAALRDASLVTRHLETRTLSIHRLVQVVVQDQMEPDSMQLWCTRVIAAVNAAFPAPDFRDWERCERYLIHALVCLSFISLASSALLEAIALLSKAGSYLLACGLYEEAEPLLERAMRWEQQRLGIDHPGLIPRLEKQAELFWMQGQYLQAESLLRQALVLGEHHLGSEHAQIAIILNRLASLCLVQGKYEDAKGLLQRGLRMQERLLGPEHPEVEKTLNKLGIVHCKQGVYEQAEVFFLRVLRLREHSLSPEHPLIVASLYNLATLYLDQERYAQAELLFLRALRLQERQLGPEHPEIAETLGQLAILYRVQESYEQAEPLYARALAISEQQLGPEHPQSVRFRQEYRSLRARRSQVFEIDAREQPELAPIVQTNRPAHSSSSHASEARVSGGLLHVGDPLQRFLDACCELHPLGWCRISDLWHAYEYWSATEQRGFPLPRRVFAAQLKARGCRLDRTNSARIWRGVSLVKKDI